MKNKITNFAFYFFMSNVAMILMFWIVGGLADLNLLKEVFSYVPMIIAIEVSIIILSLIVVNVTEE